MRFCANPRCRFHQYRIKSAGQPLVINTAPTSSVEACALKEIVYNHPYRNDPAAPADSQKTAPQPVYFCDVCHRAIELVLQQGLKVAS